MWCMILFCIIFPLNNSPLVTLKFINHCIRMKNIAPLKKRGRGVCSSLNQSTPKQNNQKTNQKILTVSNGWHQNLGITGIVPKNGQTWSLQMAAQDGTSWNIISLLSCPAPLVLQTYCLSHQEELVLKVRTEQGSLLRKQSRWPI